MHAAAGKTHRLRNCLLSLLSFVVVVFSLLLFFWNSAMTNLVNNKVQGFSMHLPTDVRGIFPFDFSVPVLDIGDQVEMRNVRIRYRGTYNPFAIFAQTGLLFDLDAPEIDVSHETFQLHHVTVRKLDRTNLLFNGFVSYPKIGVTVEFSLGVDNNAKSLTTMKLQTGSFICSVTAAGVDIRYLNRQLFKLNIDDHNFRATVASILHIHGHFVTNTPNLIILENIYTSFYNHKSQPTINKVILDIRDIKNIRFEVDDLLHVYIVNGRPIFGKIDFKGINDFKLEMASQITPPAKNLSEHVVDKDWSYVAVDPAINTPFGLLSSVKFQLNPPKIHLAMEPHRIKIELFKRIVFGPISFMVTSDRIAVQISGGFFQMFKCVYIHAYIAYDKPAALILQNATALNLGEVISGHGYYEIDSRQAHLQLNMNR